MYNTYDQNNFLIHVSDNLCKWLKTNRLEGYLQIAEVEPHPQAEEVVKEISFDKISNEHIHRFLNLNKERYNMMESLEWEVQEFYFGPYSPSAKS